MTVYTGNVVLGTPVRTHEGVPFTPFGIFNAESNVAF